MEISKKNKIIINIYLYFIIIINLILISLIKFLIPLIKLKKMFYKNIFFFFKFLLV